jgi:8-oxo-dGTP diphosphatase
VPALSIGYVATQPEVSGAGLDWLDLRAAAAGLAGRQRWLLDAAVRQVRNRMDQEPIAFRMLPPRFSLAELQGVYEILLGRRLHKASFRRALNAAQLVAPTGEWLANRRGRPAQLHRFAPRRRGTRLRPVRFDLL